MCSITAISAGALTKRLYGDINNDGIISKAYATLFQEYLAKTVRFDKYQMIAADVNVDGIVDVEDAVIMQKLLSGAIDEFEAGDYFFY